MSDDILKQNTLIIRQRVLQFLGKTFYLLKQNGSRLGIAKEDALKLKPSLRIYTQENPLQPWLIIKPKHLIQANARFEIFDAEADKLLATLQFKGVRSFRMYTRNNWLLYDEHEQPIGSLEEVGGFEMASNLAGGLIALITPRKFRGRIGEDFTFHLTGSFSPIVRSMTLSIPPLQTDTPSHRLAVACAFIVFANQFNEY